MKTLSKKVSLLAGLTVSALMFMLPGWGYAAGKGMPRGLTDVLLLLLFVGCAYAIAHLLLEYIAERFGFVTGIEYILLGVVIVEGFEIVSHSTIDQFTAVIELSTGALGLLSGLYIEIDRLRRERRALKAAIIISLSTLVCVLGIPGIIAWSLLPTESFVSLAPGIACMGAVALVAEAGPIQSLIAFLDVRGEQTKKAVITARFCSLVGIFIFGLIFCFFNTADINPSSPLYVLSTLSPAVQWMPFLGLHLVIGVVLGFVFSSFINRDFEFEQLFTVVIGLVIFTSGLAYYFNLSPIFVNFVLGVVLANHSEYSDHVVSMIRSIQRPLYIMLFFFAGARLTATISQAYVALLVLVALSYLAFRQLGRGVGGVAVNYAVPEKPFNLGIGRALLASGALSVAMLLDFNEFYSEVRIDVPLVGLEGFNYIPPLYAGLLVAVAASEIFSYATIRAWLIDSSDIDALEVKAGSPEEGQV